MVNSKLASKFGSPIQTGVSGSETGTPMNSSVQGGKWTKSERLGYGVNGVTAGGGKGTKGTETYNKSGKRNTGTFDNPSAVPVATWGGNVGNAKMEYPKKMRQGAGDYKVKVKSSKKGGFIKGQGSFGETYSGTKRSKFSKEQVY